MLCAESALFHCWTKPSAPNKAEENAEVHLAHIEPLDSSWTKLHSAALCWQAAFAFYSRARQVIIQIGFLFLVSTCHILSFPYLLMAACQSCHSLEARSLKVIISSWLDCLEREPQIILIPLILLVVRALMHLLPFFSKKNPHTDLSKDKSMYFIKWPCVSSK